MERKPVKSSNIKSMGYSKKELTLEVEFHTGKIFSYQPVTEEGYISLLKAESIGRFLANNIIRNGNIKGNQVEC